MKIKRLAASVILAIVLAVSVPAATPPSDDYITDVVRSKLAADQVVKGGAIEVTVKDGVVTLTGKVPELKLKARAEKITKGIKGVKSVVNNVRIEKQ